LKIHFKLKIVEKIINIKQAIRLNEGLREENKTIVLVGGCFDILHIGHVQFLQKAKEQGNVLIVLLESDENIRRLKGESRPFNTQIDRATILAAFSVVDYVVLLPALSTHTAYDELILQMKPDIIATTKGDAGRQHKERQGSLIGAQVVDVIERIDNRSTSSFIDKVGQYEQ
jgi:rfaE bifunctional protein nucleotidyltransferase chain/domain